MNRVITIATLITTGVLWADPQAPGTSALSRAAVFEALAEQELDGVGLIRRMPEIAPASVGAFEIGTDNVRFLVCRFATGGEGAARLYIRNMALPSGAKLFVYGLTANATVTNVHGPFEGTGPFNSGDFWTGAVLGTEIVVEFQVETIPADLPFEIVGIAPAALSEATVQAERRVEEVRTSMFRGMVIAHAVENGVAMFEGDIELGKADELPRADEQSKEQSREAVAISRQNYRWKNGIIPYSIDPALPSLSRITGAIDHWNAKMAGHVQWIPATNETASVHFARSSSTYTCSSAVGRGGYKQRINLGDACSLGSVIHEMGHTVGLWHEQSREDRDTYVKILWENMQSNVSYNFTQSIYDGEDIGLYDYGSIMHYPINGFSSNGKPTIETIPPGIPIGQRNGLSGGDIAAVKRMYPLSSEPGGPTSDITFESVPTGQTIRVDGVDYRTPKTMQWIPGSVHTVSAVNLPVVNGTRNVFVRWTNAGAQTHTIVTPAAAATYRADYATSYSATVAASAPGSVSVAPVSENTFYARGTLVAIQAIAPPGYCFASWTGLVAGTPAETTLSMQKAYTVQANYQSGSISVSPSAITVPVPTAYNTQEISVSATAGCPWAATSPASWVKITSGTSGNGPGVVTLNLVPRTKTAPQRTATLMIAGKPVVITQ